MGAIHKPKRLTINRNSILFRLWEGWAKLHGWNPENITYRGLIGSGALATLYIFSIKLYFLWTIFSWSSLMTLGWNEMILDYNQIPVAYFVIHTMALIILTIAGLYYAPRLEEMLQKRAILPKIDIVDQDSKSDVGA